MWPLNICVKNNEEARKMFKSHPKNEKEVGAASPKLWKKRPQEASFNNN